MLEAVGSQLGRRRDDLEFNLARGLLRPQIVGLHSNQQFRFPVFQSGRKLSADRKRYRSRRLVFAPEHQSRSRLNALEHGIAGPILLHYSSDATHTVRALDPQVDGSVDANHFGRRVDGHYGSRGQEKQKDRNRENYEENKN